MRFFRDLPITRKLKVAIMGTTAIALLLACAAFVTYELATFRTMMKETLTLVATSLADNGSAAVEFVRTDEAEKVLAALRIERAVIKACIYDAKGSVFAQYTRQDATNEFPAKIGADGVQFVEDSMTLFAPIKSGERRIGTIYLQSDLEAMYDRLRSILGISGIVLLGSFLLALPFSAVLQRVIAEPILALTDTAKQIAQTRDYSLRVEKLSRDELGLLADGFNQMLVDVQERTNALQHANESLRVQTAEMTDAAGVLASSASQIVAATRQLAASANDAATAVSETTTTVDEVRQTSQLSSERAKIVSDQSQDTVSVVNDGKRSVNLAIEGMTGIREQMAAISDCILSLSAQGQTIGEIIASVDDLAAQSNLLAVNAAIEAAKAGEEGRGFAIVAQEVKTLAEQSKQATTQVRAILNDIQKATSRAVHATEQGSLAVEAGMRQSSATGESIAALADSIATAAQAAVQIAATSRQQFVGMEQVAHAMESIKIASRQTVQSTRQVEGAAQLLHDLGLKLKQIAETIHM